MDHLSDAELEIMARAAHPDSDIAKLHAYRNRKLASGSTQGEVDDLSDMLKRMDAAKRQRRT
ncbi:hypothetical protein [Bradyrhizobium sp. Bra64]|uniref:hypothetical protein n=1 Tax=Bradyrhizobium sp. Bra64 TaxID=2926009 RepID=UPI00211834F9|nr:hypothetical protein [Bradyrhizobium sp. Bra64]